MKKALVLGAGNFGRYVILALRECGCEVDVVEKETAPQYALRDAGCRWFRNNAWNLASIRAIHIPEYDCCFLCLNDNRQTNLHVIGELRRLNARRIVIRAVGEEDAAAYQAAGASRVVCPEQLASVVLVRESFPARSELL